MMGKTFTKEFPMKPFSSILSTVLTGILAFILLGSRLPGSLVSASPSTQPVTPIAANQTVCDASRSIHVSGTAVINVTPDRALVQLGVLSTGPTTQLVEAMNTSATQAVIKTIQALGVDAKDITTDYYVIEPVYEDYNSLYIKGYRINNVIAVTLRDVSKTSKVIANALQAGANQVVNIDFYTSDLRKYRDQAREMAMKAAREKAEALAKAAGAESGCVLNITENSWSYYHGWSWWSGSGQNQAQWTQNVVQNIAPSEGESGAAGDEPISLGHISVKAEIDANFALK